MRQRSQGFSFLEISLAVSVAALVTLAGVSAYVTNKTRSDKDCLKQHVEFLLVATNSYYQSHCKDTVIASVSLSRLKTENFIDAIPVHPLGGRYYVAVIRAPMPSVRVQASVNLTNTSQQLAYFGANSFSNNRLTWVPPLRPPRRAGNKPVLTVPCTKETAYEQTANPPIRFYLIRNVSGVIGDGRDCHSRDRRHKTAGT